jgi:nucleolar protein 4
VEFALDNVQTLKLRNAKLQYQQQAPRDDNRNENDKPDNEGGYTHGTDRKRKSQEHDKPAKDSGLTSNSEQGDKVANGKAPHGDKSKRQKGNHKSTDTDMLSLKESPKASARKLKNNKDGPNHGSKLHEGKNIAIDSNNRKISGKKDDSVYGKRKMQNQEQAGEKVSRKRAKKNKDSIGKDTVDKLDMLIEQYKSKFSQKGSQGNDGEKKQPQQQLRKWYQS